MRSTSSTRLSDQIVPRCRPLTISHSLGTAQVGDRDGTDGALRSKHDSLPPLVPRLDGVVEVLDVIEVFFLCALSKEIGEQLRARALVGKWFGKPQQVGQIRAVAFPTPATLYAPNREQAVRGAGATRTHVKQEGPVLLRQPHAYLSFKFGKLVLGQRLLHDPLVP